MYNMSILLSALLALPLAAQEASSPAVKPPAIKLEIIPFFAVSPDFGLEAYNAVGKVSILDAELRAWESSNSSDKTTNSATVTIRVEFSMMAYKLVVMVSKPNTECWEIEPYNLESENLKEAVTAQILRVRDMGSIPNFRPAPRPNPAPKKALPLWAARTPPADVPTPAFTFVLKYSVKIPYIKGFLIYST